MRKGKFCIAIILFALAILLNIIVLMNFRQKENEVIDDFIKNKDAFKGIAELLINYEYPIIYVEDRYANEKQNTINGMITNILYDNPHRKQLYEMGYKTIHKDFGGVYFYMDTKLGDYYGIMYYPIEFDVTYNGLIDDYKRI